MSLAQYSSRCLDTLGVYSLYCTMALPGLWFGARCIEEAGEFLEMHGALPFSIGPVAAFAFCATLCVPIGRRMGDTDFNMLPGFVWATIYILITPIAITASVLIGAVDFAKALRDPLPLLQFFVTQSSRDLMALARDDIQRDAEQMRTEGYRELLVQVMTWWQSARCFGPIFIDGVHSVLKRVVPLYATLTGVTSRLTRKEK